MSEPKSDSIRVHVVLSVLLIAIHFVLSLVLPQEFDAWIYLIYLAAPIVAVLWGIYTSREYAGSSLSSLALITGGLGCWLGGELVWYYLDYIANANPYPSAADFLWLAGYPLIFFGIIGKIKRTKAGFYDLRAKAALFAALALGIVVAYFGIRVPFEAGGSAPEIIIAVLYNVGDLVLISSAVYLFAASLSFEGGSLAKSYLLMVLAITAILLADVLFSILGEEYIAGTGALSAAMDSLWMAGYLLFFISFEEMLSAKRRAAEKLLSYNLRSKKRTG
ncbi:hypothetical protein D6764_01320 [Candidatus Woesearchaeota archaeon]|nr:MAG: hypothetical protein D6764_01320 [Candidatus Woesearchaeota archaeon]